MAGLTWTTPPDEAWPSAGERYKAAVRAGLFAVMQKYQAEIEAHMRSTASWMDRTGNLRQALYTAVEPATLQEMTGMIELILAHGLFYGYYLEGIDPLHDYARTKLGDKYAIIQPTLDTYGPKIMADIRKLLS